MEIDYPKYSILDLQMDEHYYYGQVKRTSRHTLGFCGMNNASLQVYLPQDNNKLSFFIADYL